MTYLSSSSTKTSALTGTSLSSLFDDLFGTVTGTESANTLEAKSFFFSKVDGLGGNDTIRGGGLLDVLIGGAGVDTVAYDNVHCAVTVDLAKTGWQFTGGGLLDKLSGFENIIGSKYNDTLYGTSGDNRINGGAGKDKMIGRDGNDYYSVDNVGDKVIELANEGTADIVLASVDYILPENVERLAMFGTAIRGTGNAADNLIRGNALDNIITGGGGFDQVYGDLGADTFVFNYANGTDVTKVHDFVSGVDTAALKGSIFGLSAGALDADYIVFTSTGAVAPDGTNTLSTTSSHGQFIFDRYHSLWWDADGSGSGKAVLVGNFGATTLDIDDFVVI